MPVHSASGWEGVLSADSAPGRLSGASMRQSSAQPDAQDFQHVLDDASPRTVASPAVAASVMRYMQMPQVGQAAGTKVPAESKSLTESCAGQSAVASASSLPVKLQKGTRERLPFAPVATPVHASQPQPAAQPIVGIARKPLGTPAEAVGRPRADLPVLSDVSARGVKRGEDAMPKKPASKLFESHTTPERTGDNPISANTGGNAALLPSATLNHEGKTAHAAASTELSQTDVVRQTSVAIALEGAQAMAAPIAAPQAALTVTMGLLSVKPVTSRWVHASGPTTAKGVERGAASLNVSTASSTAVTAVAVAVSGANAAIPGASHGSSGIASGGTSVEKTSTAPTLEASAGANGAVNRAGGEGGAPHARVPSAGSSANSDRPSANTGGRDAASVYGDEAPRTLGATSHSLEVGLASSAHGWLRVRAELADGGGVSASLVASSDHAADELHAGLAGLSAYLKGESVGVQTLSVSSSASAGEGSREGSAAGAGGSTHAGGSARSGDSERRPAQANALLAPARVGQDAVAAMPAGVLAPGFAGGWLSVRV